VGNKGMKVIQDLNPDFARHKMPDTYQPANLLKLAYLPAISKVLSFNHNALDRKKTSSQRKKSILTPEKSPFSNKISNISIYYWSQRPRRRDPDASETQTRDPDAEHLDSACTLGLRDPDGFLDH